MRPQCIVFKLCINTVAAVDSVTASVQAWSTAVYCSAPVWEFWEFACVAVNVLLTYMHGGICARTQQQNALT
eukprot:6338290-Amphidinium_carterae.1